LPACIDADDGWCSTQGAEEEGGRGAASESTANRTLLETHGATHPFLRQPGELCRLSPFHASLHFNLLFLLSRALAVLRATSLLLLVFALVLARHPSCIRIASSV